MNRLSSTTPNSLRRGRTGFTLIELLTVIAIIAVLASLLLPVLARAKSTGKSAISSSNLRQISYGLAIYAQSNDDICVPGRPARIGVNSDPRNLYDVGNGQQFRPRWFVTLGAQSGLHAFDKPSANPADDNTKCVDNKIFICPEASDRINNRNSGYGYNYQFLGNSRSRVSGGHINFPVRMTELSVPSSTVMAASSLGTSAGKPVDARKGYRVDGSGDTSAVGNHAWALDPPRLVMGESDFCDDGNRLPQHRSAVEGRHRGRAAVVFVDTHVQMMTPEELGYETKLDGSIGISGHNRYFSISGRDDSPPTIR